MAGAMATVTDLAKGTEADGEEFFEFGISGAPGDFEHVLSQFKAAVPFEGGGRTWDPETKRWRVRAAYAPALSRLFDNFADRLEEIEAQLGLF